jgi:hypothetical protein
MWITRISCTCLQLIQGGRQDESALMSMFVRSPIRDVTCVSQENGCLPAAGKSPSLVIDGDERCCISCCSDSAAAAAMLPRLCPSDISHNNSQSACQHPNLEFWFFEIVLEPQMPYPFFLQPNMTSSPCLNSYKFIF